MQINKRITPYNHYAGRAGQSIKYIVIHYVGALGGAEDNCNYYASGDVGASAHYYVGFAGEVWQSVEDANGAWSVGGGLQGDGGHSLFGIANNYNTLNIEMCVRKKDASTQNATDKDWYFEDATVSSTIELTKLLMQKYGIPADRVIRHYDVNGKICPNPYVLNSGAWTAFKATLSTTSPVKEDIWLDWTKYESGKDGFKQTGGDAGRAYGKYQFDYRYGLIPFMQFCIDYNASRYAGFKPFIALKAGNARLCGNKDLTALWLNYCDKHATEFEDLQDKAAMTDYYYPIKSYLLKNGINLDNHDPVVRGSAFSMAIRSGALTVSNKFAGCKDSDADADILIKIYATYGQEDAGRWPRQLKEALAVLKTVTPAPDKPTAAAGTYIVQAGSYKDKKLANSLAEVLRQRGFNTLIKQESGQYKIQCGSFSNKANADKLLTCIRQCGFDAVIKASEFTPYKIKVDAADLRVRSGAGIKYTKQAYTGKGEFTIVDEQKDASGQVWGLLKAYEMERNGWVALWLDCVDRV